MYRKLTALQTVYSELEQVLIPSRDFLGQEFEDTEQVKDHVEATYSCSRKSLEWDMARMHLMSLQRVRLQAGKGKPDSEVHPMYRWLQEYTETGISWNWFIFLVDREGHPVGVFNKNTPNFESKIRELFGLSPLPAGVMGAEATAVKLYEKKGSNISAKGEEALLDLAEKNRVEMEAIEHQKALKVA